MSDTSVKQILINGRPVGIVGLEAAINAAVRCCAGKIDDEIASFILERIAAKNYIPSSARAAYASAVIREYHIAQNLTVEEETQTGLQILVLGMGCARCDQLQSDLRDVLSQLCLPADLRHVTDVREIARFGVLGAPALIINNKVVAVGEVPSKADIRRWIADASKSQNNLDL